MPIYRQSRYVLRDLRKTAARSSERVLGHRDNELRGPERVGDEAKWVSRRAGPIVVFAGFTMHDC